MTSLTVNEESSTLGKMEVGAFGAEFVEASVGVQLVLNGTGYLVVGIFGLEVIWKNLMPC